MEVVKLVLLGCSGVGKSSIAARFQHNTFIDECDPSVEDFYYKQFAVPDYRGNVTPDSPSVLLEVLGTAGQEDFSPMKAMYIRSGQGFALVYSIDKQDSFDEVEILVDQIMRVKDVNDGEIPIALVANKLDLESGRVISSADGRALAEKRKLTYIEVSAKNRVNIETLFADLIKNVSRRCGNYLAKRKRNGWKLTSDDTFTRVPSVRLYEDCYICPPAIVVPESTQRTQTESENESKPFDVKFNIKDEEGKYILAHKAVLAHCSPYFNAMFTGGTKEKTAYEIEMTDFTYLALSTAIEYCYTADVKFTDDLNVVDLLVTANKLCLGRLKMKVTEYIANGMTWNNLIEMYRLATDTDSEALKELCSFYICRLYNLLEKMHKDFSELTEAERKFFTEKRQKWTGIDEVEQYWYKKMEKNTAEEAIVTERSSSKSPKSSKGCHMM